MADSKKFSNSASSKSTTIRDRRQHDDRPRAVWPTWIQQGVKIDNLVQIAQMS